MNFSLQKLSENFILGKLKLIKNGSLNLTNYSKKDFIFGDTAGGTGSHDVSYSGSGFITSVSLTGGTEDTATYSLSIEGTGVLAQSVQ